MGTDADYFTRLADAPLARHRWIVCADVAAVFTPMMSTFTDLGAPKPLLIAGSPGTGDLPDPDHTEMVILGTSGETMLGGLRAYHAALRDLAPEVIARIEEWDPRGEARVLTTFLDTELEIAGRRSWGARPEAWLELEDKLIVDALWDRAGIPRAPSMVVEAAGPELKSAAGEMDRGAGTVWTADNREGWHGGAEYSRYVADPAAADSAVDFMEDHASRVRVMPFLEGVPCAIHGLVFPEHVAVFRPVEMVVFRQPSSDKLVYGGGATTWDPDPVVRDEMRDLARTVGAHLRAEHDFRGAFTVDGVATSGGFRPTELNPRFGAGIGAIGRSADLPLLGISRMLIAGEDADYRPADLESIATAAADATRRFGVITPIWHPITETREVRLTLAADTSITVAADEEGNGTMSLGPAGHGGVVMFRLDDGEAPPGTQAAPLAVRAFALADELWDTGIGELIPALPA